MKKNSFALVAVTLLAGLATLSPRDAHAIFPQFNPQGSIAATTAQVNSLLQLASITWDHRAYQPATALGMVAGVDIGVEATGLSVPSDIATAITTFTGQTVPSMLLLPKLNVHKGLPFGIDIGASFTTVPAGTQRITSIGGDVKWAVINNVALPAVAVRGSFASNNFWFMSSTTWNVEALVSKNLVFIDPYVGGGVRFWNGSVAVPTGALPAGISASSSGTTPHVFAGIPLKMGFFHLTGEVDYSTSGLLVYGGKVSLAF